MDDTTAMPGRVLITEDETVVYNGHFHFMLGIKWLLLSLALLATGAFLAYGTLYMPPPDGTAIQPTLMVRALSITAAVMAFGFLIWYLLPFWRSFLVITNQRCLVGVGHFTSVQEQVLPYQLEDWELRQNFFESLLSYGHITLRLIEGRQLRIVHIPYAAEPHTFLRKLEELCPPEIRHSAQRAIAAAQAEPAPPPPTGNKKPAPQ
ncbi:MAG: hypothetical protein GC129_05250 [Proteobacteria bacterium]|nr:hypothetical protein [Pseudomonadota bacterium]